MSSESASSLEPPNACHVRWSPNVSLNTTGSELRTQGSRLDLCEQPAASALMRLQMLELAVQDQSGLTVDTRELNRPGPSYMVDTLKSLRQECNDEPLLLFIGSDAFNHLKSWHQWRHLFDFAHIVVMTRPGADVQHLDDFLKARLAGDITELVHNTAGKLYFQQVTQLDISATAIRNMIAKKQNPGFLLPDAVIAYIRQHTLYQRT